MQADNERRFLTDQGKRLVSPGARATARWRRRRARGSLVVSVELISDEVQALVRLNLLQPSDASQHGRIGSAVEDLVERVLKRAARSKGAR